MQHKCKVTVLECKCFCDYQGKYLADPKSGPCPMYHAGDEFIFERYGAKDDFWHMGYGAQCSEAWDAVARYIYTALQGGSIMHGWTNDDRMMIACCSDGTRPVIFKIERIDYKVVKIEGMGCERCEKKIEEALSKVSGVKSVKAYKDKQWAEVFLEDGDVDDALLAEALKPFDGTYRVTGID